MVSKKRKSKCAYHAPDKEAYLLKGRVCEPFARAWSCCVRTCCRRQPRRVRPHWRSSIRQPATRVKVKLVIKHVVKEKTHNMPQTYSFTDIPTGVQGYRGVSVSRCVCAPSIAIVEPRGVVVLFGRIALQLPCFSAILFLLFSVAHLCTANWLFNR